MTTKTTRKNLDRAIEAAKEYARLTASGDIARADQVERTIDELVGYRAKSGAWAWPAAVRRVAHGR